MSPSRWPCRDGLACCSRRRPTWPVANSVRIGDLIPHAAQLEHVVRLDLRRNAGGRPTWSHALVRVNVPGDEAVGDSEMKRMRQRSTRRTLRVASDLASALAALTCTALAQVRQRPWRHVIRRVRSSPSLVVGYENATAHRRGHRTLVAFTRHRCGGGGEHRSNSSVSPHGAQQRGAAPDPRSFWRARSPLARRRSRALDA
jgi:hypothetical protein